MSISIFFIKTDTIMTTHKSTYRGHRAFKLRMTFSSFRTFNAKAATDIAVQRGSHENGHDHQMSRLKFMAQSPN